MNPLTKKLIVLWASSIISVTGGYLIQPFEGKSNAAYLDMVGIPTLCFGETKGVKLGDYKTDKECEESLAKELTKYNKAMLEYVKVELKPYEEVAYTSFIWNLGETNFKNSTLLKKLNTGDSAGACEQLLSWNKVTVLPAGVPAYRARGETCTVRKDGKYSCTVKGLTNRRKFEYEVCMGKNAEVNKALEAVKQP